MSTVLTISTSVEQGPQGQRPSRMTIHMLPWMIMQQMIHQRHWYLVRLDHQHVRMVDSRGDEDVATSVNKAAGGVVVVDSTAGESHRKP